MLLPRQVMSREYAIVPHQAVNRCVDSVMCHRQVQDPMARTTHPCSHTPLEVPSRVTGVPACWIVRFHEIGDGEDPTP